MLCRDGVTELADRVQESLGAGTHRGDRDAEGAQRGSGPNP